MGGGQDGSDGSAVWLDADGVLSVGVRQEGSRAVDWRRISRDPVEAAVAVRTGDTLGLVARCGGELLRSVVRPDGTVVSPWAPAFHTCDTAEESLGLRGALTVAHARHATAVAARNASAMVVCILTNDGFEPATHFSVPGEPCTPFAMTWATDETLALVSLHPSGMTLIAEWHDAAVAQWRELESPRLDAVTALPRTDDGPAVLVGLTIDRKLVVRPLGIPDETGWQDAGSLDQLLAEGEEMIPDMQRASQMGDPVSG